MSQHNYNPEKYDDFFKESCPECGGTGISYADKVNRFCPITCPTCNGSGRGKLNNNKLSTVIVICIILFGLGYAICKFLN